MDEDVGVSANNRGHFFALSRPKFHEVCEYGVNVACLYIVMARGTGKSNCMTSWSCHALQRYTSITRSRAKAAKDAILQSGLVSLEKAGNHPRYRIQLGQDEELVWLPNEIVDGAAKETTPLERLRQTADPLVFRLFADIYAVSNFADDSGVPKEVMYQEYERKRIGESRQFTFWGFKLEIVLLCN